MYSYGFCLGFLSIEQNTIRNLSIYLSNYGQIYRQFAGGRGRGRGVGRPKSSSLKTPNFFRCPQKTGFSRRGGEVKDISANIKESIYLSIYLYIYLSIFISIYLTINLST